MRIKKEIIYKAWGPDENNPMYCVEIGPDNYVKLTLCPRTLQQRTVDLPLDAAEFIVHVALKKDKLNESNGFANL